MANKYAYDVWVTRRFSDGSEKEDILEDMVFSNPVSIDDYILVSLPHLKNELVIGRVNHVLHFTTYKDKEAESTLQINRIINQDVREIDHYSKEQDAEFQRFADEYIWKRLVNRNANMR